VANTMQDDKFKFQTVANTRQMVPAKKSQKKTNLLKKKILKLSHTLLFIIVLRLVAGNGHDKSSCFLVAIKPF